jgi:hypothetical protein
MTDDHDKALKPSEQRTAERRQQKQEGRGRRAELLIERKAKEKVRQDALEDRQTKLDGRLAQLEQRLDAHERRLQQLEKPAPRPATPNSNP